MKVAVICEFSGIVREAFRSQGHDATSYDLLDTEIPSIYHIKGYVQALPMDWWESYDLAIIHPPCTYLANSGVRWLINNPERMAKMREAAEFFNWCMNLPIPRICVENPIQHKYARELIRPYDQITQPWQHGDGETKATCLWLKNLPPLKASNIVTGRADRVHKLPPGPDRWKERSRTYPGIAKAMADQWGGL